MRFFRFAFLMIAISFVFANFADADPTPFSRFNKDSWFFKNIHCKDEKFLKLKNGKQIVKIDLIIGDFIYESGNAKALGIERKYDLNGPIKLKGSVDINDSFINSIKKYNPDKEIAFYISDDRNTFTTNCYSEPRKNKNQRCIEKAESYISAKYGNALIRYSCSLDVKGSTFPILLQSKCSIKVGEKPDYSEDLELTDINYFEGTSIKQGVMRLLDEHAKNLSTIFEKVKLCN
jgi:hypothetical protein